MKITVTNLKAKTPIYAVSASGKYIAASVKARLTDTIYELMLEDGKETRLFNIARIIPQDIDNRAHVIF